MCNYDDVDAGSQQAMRGKGRRLEALQLGDDTVERHFSQLSYGYLYLEIGRHVAFVADEFDNPDYTYSESWSHWKRLLNGSIAPGNWVEKTMHWLHFSLGYIVTDPLTMERLVKHINL